jgi:hypothetical protein
MTMHNKLTIVQSQIKIGTILLGCTNISCCEEQLLQIQVHTIREMLTAIHLTK